MSKGFTQYDGFDIEYLKLNTRSGDVYDIKNFMVELNIYTSIYSKSINGSLLVNDGANMLSNLPILGGERIDVSWRTKGRNKWKRYSLIVESVSEREDSGKSSAYRIQLVSVDQYFEVTNPTSRGYKGTYTDMIRAVIGSMSKNRIELSETAGIHTLATPMWTPFQLIEWCTQRSIHNDGTPMVFFEDLDGYKFKSIGELVSQESEGRLYKQPYGIESDPIKILRNVDQIDWRPNRNVMDLAVCGCKGHLESVFDFNNKTTTNVHNTYDSFFKETPHLEKYPISDDQREFSHNIWDLTTPDGSHKGRFARDVLNATLFHTTLGITLMGDDEFVLGGVYDFNVPSPEPTANNEAPVEKYVSGRWLTTSVRHSLRTSGYSMSVEIAKDSYSQDIKG